jgi:threonine synthase
VPVSVALRDGIAPDGGLYVPTSFPTPTVTGSTLPEVASTLLAPFFADDPLESELPSLCAEAFDFPVPVRPLFEGVELLELFHGPTAAFKDFGARFLAACFARIVKDPLTIVVATSGDTGGAVAAAFHGRPNVDVVVLYPKGGVSARQEKQLCAFGGNVRAFAVRGVFDDCQRLAKEALRAWGSTSSANSINVGRLLPQMAYYALATHARGPTTVVVPTGNLGNATAALWAKRCGLPIERVVLATNANRPIPDFLATGRYDPRATVRTLANAMDVGAPSNLERVRHLYGDDLSRIRVDVRAESVDDAEIRATIARVHARTGVAICPHTACGVAAWERLGGGPALIAATAHPAKFETVVEPLIGAPVEVPPALAALLARDGRATEIEPTLAALDRAVGR